MQEREEKKLEMFSSFKKDNGYMINVTDDLLRDVERAVELWAEDIKMAKEIINFNKPIEEMSKYFELIDRHNKLSEEVTRLESRIGNEIVRIIKDIPF